MKICFLGTGTSHGIPCIGCECLVCTSIDFRDKRSRSAIHIEKDGVSIIIDAGPDFRQQVMREKILHVDALLITHAHKDHTAGLDDIRSYNYLQKSSIPVFGSAMTIKQIKQEFEYIFTNSTYPGVPQLDIHEITNKEFFVKKIRIIPIEVFHHKLPVFGFRIDDFTYITDANYIHPYEIEKIRGSKVVVLNALRREEHISHYTLDQAVKILKEIKPEKAFLTHISHQLGLHEVVNRELPEFIKCGYDGLKVEL